MYMEVILHACVIVFLILLSSLGNISPIFKIKLLLTTTAAFYARSVITKDILFEDALYLIPLQNML